MSIIENLYENKIVCYKYVGCFNNFFLFDNVVYDLLCLFEEIGIEFLLFIWRNLLNLDCLDYVF